MLVLDVKMFFKILFLLFLNAAVVKPNVFSENRVASQVWQEHCPRHGLALNDCNWCKCDSRLEYKCTARICSQVDMFGHFNDAIKEVDPGMEGHGVWRSAPTACEPGVHYRKGDLLCACTEDGKWPNPICRDIFQVLHNVEPTEFKEVNQQSCMASMLYQVECNVCYCNSSGYLDPSLCTKRNCTEDVVNHKDEDSTAVIRNGFFEEVYAPCERAKKYQLGCKTCVCVPNNRLLCDDCTELKKPTFKSQKVPTDNNSLCFDKTPGEKFISDCNICYCDAERIIYCSIMKCLELNTDVTVPEIDFEAVEAPADDTKCIPNTEYKRCSNSTCQCFMIGNIKYFKCSFLMCTNKANMSLTVTDACGCVEGKTYEKNCLICKCVVNDGIKEEICTENEKCKKEPKRTGDFSSLSLTPLDSMHGYCEPLHEYQNDCNKCKCLIDSKTVACTSRRCLKSQEPLIVEFIPFVQKNNVCPPGHKYKIDCNVCHCLPNGNALCTTNKCTKGT